MAARWRDEERRPNASLATRVAQAKLIEFQRRMAILITFLLLLGTALALQILRVFRPRFRLSWLLAILATAGAWTSVLLWRPLLPLTLDAALWQSAASANSFVSFTVNDTNWPYALSLVSLALAMLLTAPLRSHFPNPTGWAICLATVGIGILAAAADSPLTLVLIWAGLDLAEAGFLLFRRPDPSSSGSISYAFTMRLGSMALLLLALVLANPGDSGTTFGELRGTAAQLLLPAAALLRLAALAIPGTQDSQTPGSDEIGTTLQITAGVSAIAFLSQLSPEANNSALGILILCALASVYAGWMFLRAPDEYSARPLWIFGLGSLAAAATIRANTLASAGWGCALLLAGGALFLRARGGRWTNRILLLGLWSLSSLPLSITATAWGGGRRTFDWILPVLFIGQGVLIAGYVHWALRSEENLSGRPEVAALRGIHGAGIGTPLLVALLLGFWGWPGAFQFGEPLAAVLIIPLSIGLVWGKRRLPLLSPSRTDWFPAAWSRASAFAGREMRRLEAGLQGIAASVTRMIEGEAGIMWSLLFLVLFVSLIARRDQ